MSLHPFRLLILGSVLGAASCPLEADYDRRLPRQRNRSRNAQPATPSRVEVARMDPVRRTGQPLAARTGIGLYLVSPQGSWKDSAGPGTGLTLAVRFNTGEEHEGRLRVDYVGVGARTDQPPSAPAYRAQGVGMGFDWMPRLLRWENGGLRFILGGGCMGWSQDVAAVRSDRDASLALATGLQAQLSRQLAVELRYTLSNSLSGGRHAQDLTFDRLPQVSLGLGWRLK